MRSSSNELTNNSSSRVTMLVVADENCVDAAMPSLSVSRRFMKKPVGIMGISISSAEVYDPITDFVVSGTGHNSLPRQYQRVTLREISLLFRWPIFLQFARHRHVAESCRFLIQPWYYLDFLISSTPRLTGAEINLPQATFTKKARYDGR
jgi:hypothetical protein